MGPQINFNIRKLSNFKKVLGGTISLVNYFLYIIFFILFGKELLLKTNPNVISEHVNPNEFPKYQISNETFLVWRIEDFYGKVSNLNEIFTVISYFQKYFPSNGTLFETKEIKFISCANEKLKKFFISDTAIKAEQWSCLDFSELICEELFGDINTLVWNYIEFQLDICKTDPQSKKKIRSIVQIFDL